MSYPNNYSWGNHNNDASNNPNIPIGVNNWQQFGTSYQVKINFKSHLIVYTLILTIHKNFYSYYVFQTFKKIFYYVFFEFFSYFWSLVKTLIFYTNNLIFFT